MVLELERPLIDDQPPAPEPVLRVRRRNWTFTHGFVALVYLSAAIAIMGSMWVDPSGRTFVANPSDQTWFEWMLRHGVRVFSHGENPLYTNLLNVPLGVNLMANTNVLALSLPFAPLTAWLGPSVVYVLLLTLGLAGTAYAWYYVIYRHFVGDRIAAIVGGAICGFGPGIIAHSNGHPNLTAQFLVPLILWRALAMRHTTRAWRDGAILAGLIVLQLFINEEVLLDTALAGTVFVITYLVMRPSTIRLAPRMLRGIGAAALIGATLAAYPIWYQFAGPGHVNGLPLYQQNLPYRLPLVSYVTLPSQSLWGNPLSNLAQANPAEENSFLGWPVIIVAIAIVILLWRRSVPVRALSVVGVVFAYASLGNRVTVANPQLSYPYSLWSHLYALPVFNNIVPTRLALVVLPAVGLLFAHAISRAARAWNPRPRPVRLSTGGSDHPVRRQLRVRLLVARPTTKHRLRVRASAAFGLVTMAIALMTIIPTQPATAVRERVPAFFLDGTWRQYVPAGYTVLTADPIDRVANMRWSVANNLAFGIPGGYFLGPNTNGRARFGPVPRPTMTILISTENGHKWAITPARVAQAIADVRYWRTAIIVLAPGHPYEETALVTLDGLFGPGLNVDGIWIWNVLPLTNGPEATYSGVDGRAVAPLMRVRF